MSDKSREIEFANLVYLPDKEGKITKKKEPSWEPKDIAHEQAWDEIKKRLDIVYREIQEGESSPIAFFLELQLMTPRRLSGYSNIPLRTVKKHLKKKYFEKLSADILKKYADVFELPLNYLTDFNKSIYLAEKEKAKN